MKSVSKYESTLLALETLVLLSSLEVGKKDKIEDQIVL